MNIGVHHRLSTSSNRIRTEAKKHIKIPFKHSQIIWYTGCDKYTPDLIIGGKLIIEVDGKIHDKEFLKTPDRIRQRALKNMGFEMHRVRNERIQSAPHAVAADIIQKIL